jgi:hypothetical protein
VFGHAVQPQPASHRYQPNAGVIVIEPDALLAPLMTQVIQRSGPSLVHDPTKEGGVHGVVRRCSPPYLMEDVD